MLKDNLIMPREMFLICLIILLNHLKGQYLEDSESESEEALVRHIPCNQIRNCVVLDDEVMAVERVSLEILGT